jgi:CubicO group peptidase (beta-lactamase class C family)
MSIKCLASQRSAPTRLTRRAALRLVAAATAGGFAGTVLHPASARAGGTESYSRSPVQTASAEFDALDAQVRAAMAAAGVPGAAVGVLYRGQEYVAGYGVTNVDYPLAVDADTLFQIGSITKTFTMAAAMRLVEQGRLALDEPIRHYLPDLSMSDPDVAARVTMRHLLTHTSGLPADNFAPMGGGDEALAQYVAEEVPREPLILPLGRYPSYSNIALSLAGRVVEVVSERPYEVAIRQLLFEPLGMERATFFAADAIIAATAAGHTVLDTKPFRQRPWALPRTADAAGGIVASVREMLRYARLWLGDGLSPDGARLLTPESLAQIGTPQSRQPADLLTFGLSWALADENGVKFWTHGGGTSGQNSRLLMARERDFAYCALTNVVEGSAVLGAGQRWATENLLGMSPAASPAPPPLPLDAAALATYAGEYENPGEALHTLRVRDNGLELTSKTVDPFFAQIQPAVPDPPPVQLGFSARDVVYAVDEPKVRSAFLRNPDGSIAGLFVGGRFNVRR